MIIDMQKKQIYASIEASLIADAYTLGAHWIYDEHQLSSLAIDWDELNAPQALWHKGKEKGDFTHYGDHTLWLYECVTQTNSFSIEGYRDYWLTKMQSYTGYVDGSSRETMALLKQDPALVHGSASHDLSIIGRIAPLLLISASKEEFLVNVNDFVSFTHNSPLVKEAAQFFGNILYDVMEGNTISNVLKTAYVSEGLSHRYEQALKSQGLESFDAIRTFGPACGVEGGFEGVIHLLITYQNFKDTMIANAKAGGDSAARGMIVGMLLGAEGCEIPTSWKNTVKKLPIFQ